MVLAKGPSLAAEFDLDEVVTIPIISRLKGEIGAYAQGHRADHRSAKVEVVMEEPGWATPDDAVIRSRSGKLGQPGAKRATHLHAAENAVDSVLIPALQALPIGPDTLLLADALFCF